MSTITQEQFEAAQRAWRHAQGGNGLELAFAAAGITITPPAPPETMVKLAREIAVQVLRNPCNDEQWKLANASALAALQHVEKLLRDARCLVDSDTKGDALISRNDLLTAIGSNAA